MGNGRKIAFLWVGSVAVNLHASPEGVALHLNQFNVLNRTTSVETSIYLGTCEMRRFMDDQSSWQLARVLSLVERHRPSHDTPHLSTSQERIVTLNVIDSIDIESKKL